MARPARDERSIPALLAALCEGLTASSVEFVTLTGSKRSERPASLENLAALLVRSDAVLGELLERTRRTYVLPADRGSLTGLALHLNESAAALHGAAEAIVAHRIGELPVALVRAADLAARSCEILQGAFSCPFRPPALTGPAREIHRLVREARSVMRTGLAEVVVGTADPRKTLRFNDAFTHLAEVLSRLDRLAETALILAIRET